jgi:hypothetical protein
MDKNVLLRRKASLGQEAVTIDQGIVVTVRGLTNGEVRTCRETAEGNSTAYEREVISAALVDPVMTPAEVALWLDGDPNDPEDMGAPAGDSVKVMAAVQRLSGLAKEDATKSVPAVRKPRQRR